MNSFFFQTQTGTYRSKENDEGERDRAKDFFFDYSYWSMDPNSPKFASQEQVIVCDHIL